MIYLANWATDMDRQCLRDDGGMDLEDLANPRGVVLMDRDDATITAMLAMAWQESVLDMWDDAEAPPDPKWETKGWMEADAQCRGFQEWFEIDHEIMVVVTTPVIVQPDKGPL